MYDFVADDSALIMSGGNVGGQYQGQNLPAYFGEATGVLSPDGKILLHFCWEYVLQRTALPHSLPLER